MKNVKYPWIANLCAHPSDSTFSKQVSWQLWEQLCQNWLEFLRNVRR